MEVADIFREHGEVYRRTHALTAEQRRVMGDIERCRTAALGGHLDYCDTPGCGYSHPAYNSCRNRHCPKCQALAQARWIEQRKARILPTSYFHVVFTLPSQLKVVALRNRRVVFDLLFAAAAQTLLALAKDPKRLGAQIGFTAVLHTWTRDLRFHPHLHCIVTAGGLDPSGERWVPSRSRFLFPVKVLGRLFRGKFLAGLRTLHDAGRLDLAGCCAHLAKPGRFAELLDALYGIDWVVYSKPPFAGPNYVYHYLGRYTHRTGISNRRLLAHDARGVTFGTKDGKAVTVPAEEFIRRFLLHVLPDGFVKIRHFGLMAAGNVHARLERARTLLLQRQTPEPAPPPTEVDRPAPASWQERLLELTGRDVRRCPRCGCGPLRRRRLAPIRGSCESAGTWDTS